LQQTFTVVGTGGAIDFPQDAFIPWQNDAECILRGQDQETGCKHVVPGADKYQLMVEHFSDAVLGKSKLNFLFEDAANSDSTLTIHWRCLWEESNREICRYITMPPTSW
jgi:hypothetical protein